MQIAVQGAKSKEMRKLSGIKPRVTERTAVALVRACAVSYSSYREHRRLDKRLLR